MYQGKYTKSDSTPPKAPVAPAPEQERKAAPEQPVSAPERTAPVRRTPAKRRRRKNTKNGTVLFYTVYFAFILVFFIAILCVMNPLRDWLVKYEASQPSYQRDQVFSQLFDHPDWKSLYTLAGCKDTEFVNADAYAAYMTQKVGNRELECLETSAGLSGDKKFLVKLGEEKIASFTLTGGEEEATEIANWKLGTVEVFFTANESVTAEKIPGYTLYVNGVPLDDSHTIREVATLAENYLPEGIHGYRLVQQQATGLLAAPSVQLKDEAGNAIDLTLDAQTGIYKIAVTTHEATQAEMDLAKKATETYAKYMIGKTTLSEVKKLYNPESQFYKTISRSEVGWVQSGASYAFTEPVYSDFYRYAEDLFSIRLDMTLEQTRFDGSVKEYSLDNTLFFQRDSKGNWIVMEATNVNVQDRTESVRLTFLDAQGGVLSTSLVEADANKIVLPAITAPEGNVLKGWGTQALGEDGKITMTMQFTPTESGEVYLPSDSTLEPMVLYPYFEEVTE